MPPERRKDDRRAKRDGKTEAEVEAEKKAKAEKDEADFQVSSSTNYPFILEHSINS